MTPPQEWHLHWDWKGEWDVSALKRSLKGQQRRSLAGTEEKPPGVWQTALSTYQAAMGYIPIQNGEQGYPRVWCRATGQTCMGRTFVHESARGRSSAKNLDFSQHGTQTKHDTVPNKGGSSVRFSDWQELTNLLGRLSSHRSFQQLMSRLKRHCFLGTQNIKLQAIPGMCLFSLFSEKASNKEQGQQKGCQSTNR